MKQIHIYIYYFVTVALSMIAPHCCCLVSPQQHESGADQAGAMLDGTFPVLWLTKPYTVIDRIQEI